MKETGNVKVKEKMPLREVFIVIMVLGVLVMIGNIVFSGSNSKDAAQSTTPYQLARDTAYEKLTSKQTAQTSADDAATVKRLSKLVNFKKDEFQGITWVLPKVKPVTYVNGIYCYFGQEAGKATNFRFRIQYASSDWLFIKQYRFIIDGQPFTYEPDKVERDNASGDIWEWSDQQVLEPEAEIIRALAVAKTAKVRFEGQQYYKDRIITSAQLTGIKNMFSLYQAMGGTFSRM